MKGRLKRISAMIVRHLFVLPREIEGLAEVFWWPSFDLFIWGLMTVYIQSKQGVDSAFIGIFLGAVILWMFVYRSQQEMGLTFLREVWDRNILNILTTPLTIWEFLTSTLILGILKLTISSVWMFFLANLLFKFNIFSLGAYLIPFVANLLVLGWSAGFIINGLIIRYGFRIQAFAWILILVIQPFSAVFYPVSVMPVWMQYISRVIPTSYIFEGMRAVVLSGSMNFNLLLTATFLNVCYLIGSVLFFKFIFNKALQSGTIVKFS